MRPHRFNGHIVSMQLPPLNKKYEKEGNTKRKFSGGDTSDLRHKTESTSLVTPDGVQTKFVTQPQFH